MRLKDKVAVITAAGSGAGRAGAVMFAHEGAKVVVGDISSKAGQETVDMVTKAGGEATFVQVDVGKVEDMRRLIEATVKAYGTINILWNHAGIPGPGLIEDTEEDAFDNAISVNIKGGFFAAKFAIPHMKQAGSGSIIFTASVAALRGSQWSPSYSLAKGGLIPFTMSLAVYLGPHNIRANCICPGAIDTPMLRVFVDRTGSIKEDVKENMLKEVMKKFPIQRLATPGDIANAALFIASDEASYISGVILPVDGAGIAKMT